MEYAADGTVELYPTMIFSLLTPVEFQSPSGVRITLNSVDDRHLAVRMTLEEGSDAAANERMEIELKRICDLLSYFCGIPILKSSIAEITSNIVTPEGKHASKFTARFAAMRTVVRDYSPESIPGLTNRLETGYASDFEDVISMWREAISTEAPSLKYLLLYRLLEFLIGKNVTDWITNKEPSVKILSDRGRNVTMYTHLRDSIHPKQKTFPIRDINDCLPRLERLVKEAIEENFC
jgi:hypothetical protein